MSNAVEKLLALAGTKKPTQKKIKYTKKVEKSWDKAYEYFVHKMGYGSNDRAFRLLKRIRYALEVEGYQFKKDMHSRATPSSSVTMPMGIPKLNEFSHVACNGSVCTLLRSRPPKGLGIDSTIRLTEFLRSKQCYRFSMKPKDKSRKRTRGKNVVLPKPCTWHRLQKHGLQIEAIFDEENSPVLESFRVDGILAYSEDRQNFFVPNQEMCRRWLEGVDRMIDADEKR